VLYVSVAGLTNVAVADGTGCLFTRAASGGLDAMVHTLAERRGLTVEHSQQWLQHVGLHAPLEDVEGDPDLVAAARATLEEVLTPAAFEGMFALRERYVDGVREVLADGGIPWTIVSLGARAELAFAADPPRTGGASAPLFDTTLEDALHLFLLNRGVMITPFHNMALMSPATTAADVDRHTEVFGEAVEALVL
jgi:glutamate-1-semialdehyde aminotransferase